MNMQQVFKALKEDFPPPNYISVEASLTRYPDGDTRTKKEIYLAPFGSHHDSTIVDAPTWDEALEAFVKERT